MQSLKEALKLIQSQACLPPVEADLMSSGLMVTASALVAKESYPRFDNSAMDGFALRYSDVADLEFPLILPIQALSLAGEGRLTLESGRVIRIMTGAILPAGADTVVPLEDVQVFGQTILLQKRPSPKKNVRYRGEDFLQESVLIDKDQILSPQSKMAIASADLRLGLVRKLSEVLILTTGGEVHQKGNIAQASVLDAVTPWLKEALFQMGIHKTRTHHLGEMSEKLGQCLGKKRKPGLAITVGGASVGDADFMPRTLKSLGFLPLIQKVDLRPGKPFCLFEKNGFYVACLPGNPFAALATFRILVVPLIFRLLGASLAEPVMLTGRQESFGTVRLLKARQVLREDRTLGVEILEGNEAFKVLSLKDCDALYAEGAGFSCFWPLNPMHSYRLHSEIPFPAPLLKGSVCLGI